MVAWQKRTALLAEEFLVIFLISISHVYVLGCWVKMGQFSLFSSVRAIEVSKAFFLQTSFAAFCTTMDFTLFQRSYHYLLLSLYCLFFWHGCGFNTKYSRKSFLFLFIYLFIILSGVKTLSICNLVFLFLFLINKLWVYVVTKHIHTLLSFFLFLFFSWSASHQLPIEFLEASLYISNSFFY